MAKKIYDAVATIGEYKAASGEIKKRYMTLGSVFESDNGMSLKLDAVPVGLEWNGWISFFVPKERENPAPQQSNRQQPSQQQGAPFDDLDVQF
jgi:hypothetical protein